METKVGEDAGCAYLVDAAEAGRDTPCGAPRRPGSSYCPDHHARCHIPGGSLAEAQRLRETEALANAVGGRRGRPARQPPEQFLRRLDRARRAASRPGCSRFIPREANETIRSR